MSVGMVFTPQDERSRPAVDMTPDGRFLPPPRPPMTLRIGSIAVMDAVLAAGLGVAALALWFAVILLPVAIGAAVVAWLAFKFQVWRTRGSFGRHPGGFPRR